MFAGTTRPQNQRWITILLCLFTFSAANLSASPPNFVVIFADDLGYGDLACYGAPTIRTPRLDRMAAEGIKFTSFYAQPICGPSRAAIMTGCYPMRVAERGNLKNTHPILHSEEITIAEILKTKGYATACFGKWDLAKHSQGDFHPDLMPNHQGFDYFFGTPTSNDRIVNLYRNEELIEEKAPMATLTKRYTDEALAFIERSKDRPFFVYFPHTMPHTRLGASAEFLGKSKRGLYGDVVEEIDHSAGRILDRLEELGLAENTYVIFTSDNGPWVIKKTDGGSAGHLRSAKVSTWEGGVRVPFILWAPGRVPAGTTTHRIARTLDILPTLAELAGAEAPTDRVIDGQSIVKLFHGEEDAPGPDNFFYYLHVHLQAVRQGAWKLHLPRPAKPPWITRGLVHHPHIDPEDLIAISEPLLFNVETDLREERDVAADHPEIVARLLALAEDAKNDVGDYDRIGSAQRFFDEEPRRPAAARWIK